MSSPKKLKLTLRRQSGVENLELEDEVFVIGRADAVRVTIADCVTLSREHLRVKVQGDEIWICDLSSSNGSYYGGKRLAANQAVRYREGESLVLGAKDEGVTVSMIFHEESNAVEEDVDADDSPLTSLPPFEPSRILEASDLLEAPKVVFEKPQTSVSRVLHKPQTPKLPAADVLAVQSKRDDLNAELAQVEAKVKMAALQVEELKIKEESQKKILADLESEVEKRRESIRNLDKEVGESRERRKEAESEYAGEEKRISTLRSTLEDELERFKKKLQIDRENMEAEAKLTKTKVECEVEEIRSKKITIEHEIKAMTEDRARAESVIQTAGEEKAKIEEAGRVAKKRLSDTEKEFSTLDENKIKLEKEIKELNKKTEELSAKMQKALEENQVKLAAEREAMLASTQKEKASLEVQNGKLNEVIEAAHDKAKKIVTDAEERALKLLAEIQKQAADEREQVLATLAKEKASVEAEINTLSETVQGLSQRIEDANQQAAKIIEDGKSKAEVNLATADLEIVKLKGAWTEEYTELKGKAMADYEAATKAWKQEFAATREKDSQELRMMKTEEEKRVREILLKDLNNLVHHIASASLAQYATSKTVDVAVLMTTLEGSIKNAIEDNAVTDKTFNPHLKKLVKKFRLQAVGAIAAGIALVFGFIHGPKFMSDKIAVLKAENQKENDEFMKEVRAQRERMLALNLVARVEFQETYIDNILYNTGYLAMKQDESLRKEWVARLSKFFFEELLFDDRKVVDFVPIETSMIHGLADISNVLNSRNFDVNLVQMKKIEKEKMEEMWFLVGGRDNWVKLRKCEAEFYAQHMHTDDKARVPAGKK